MPRLRHKLRILRWIFPIILLTGGCFETSSPTIDEANREYLGEVVEFRFDLPPYESGLDDPRPDFWRGTDAVTFRFRHQGGNSYAAFILPTVGDKTIAGFADEPNFYEEESFGAALRVLEEGDGYKVILADLDTTFDGPSFTAFAILSTKTASFMGYLPCARISEIKPRHEWRKVRCDEGPARVGLKPFGTVQFYDDMLEDGISKLGLYQDFVRRRLFVFAVDCDAFPEFSESAFGFETSCLSWESGWLAKVRKFAGGQGFAGRLMLSDVRNRRAPSPAFSG